MCRSIMSLSEIVRQIWCDDPLSERSTAIKREGEGIWLFGGRGWSKFEKNRGRQYRGGLHKIVVSSEQSD